MHTALNTLERTLQRNAPRIITATPSTTAQLAPSGAFALRAGRAMTLQPHTAATLRITQGTAWVTLASLPGDHFLSAGDNLAIHPGDRVVMQAWHVPAHESLYFDWDSTALQVAAQDGMAVRGNWLAAARAVSTSTSPTNNTATCVSASPLGVRLLSPSYCDAVLAPLADLRGAVLSGASAAARLALGLVVWTLSKALGKVLNTTVFLATPKVRPHSTNACS